nr:hypothetical protein OG781_21755 [Streptomyces sp. NBC_00830]
MQYLAEGLRLPTNGLDCTIPAIYFVDAIPLLMQELLPNGVLGTAVTGLPAAFMAGMAANVSSFNTVFTTDIWGASPRPRPVSSTSGGSSAASS